MIKTHPDPTKKSFDPDQGFAEYGWHSLFAAGFYAPADKQGSATRPGCDYKNHPLH